MDRNFSLHSLPLPLNDLTAAIKANTSPQFLKSYGVVEDALRRNQSSELSTPEQGLWAFVHLFHFLISGSMSEAEG